MRRKRLYAGVNQTQRIKPFSMYVADVRRVSVDKSAPAWAKGTTVSTIAWESTDDTVTVSNQALSSGVGSATLSPSETGVRMVKVTTTYANGQIDVDYFRLAVLFSEAVTAATPPAPEFLEYLDGSSFDFLSGDPLELLA